MYHFRLNGVVCQCDTLGELRAACTEKPIGVEVDMKVRGLEPEWFGDAGDKLNQLLKDKETSAAADTVAVAAHKRRRRKGSRKIAAKIDRKHRGIPRIVEKSADDLASLPLIKGGVTWVATKKVAKKLGRIDYRQLRSELFARKKLG